MIQYQSHSLGVLFGWSGSVIPKASCFALVSGLAAVVLKILDQEGIMNVHGTVSDNAAFGMYSGTLAFLLVFRTSKCYSRFWMCASSACTFRAQLSESASSLVSFSQMSNSPAEDIDYFRRSVVTFASLIHASAMSHLSNCDIRHYAVIDYNAIDENFRTRFEAYPTRSRVDLAYSWLNSLIIRNLKSGLLNVPPPILSRVFQETEKAMVEYNQVLEVMSIPFPFPYAQTAMLLLVLVGIFTPFAMCSWTDHPATAGVMTFIAVVCLLSLELVAGELENPFGGFANDLPCVEFQLKFNETLEFLSSSDASEVPGLHFATPLQTRFANSPNGGADKLTAEAVKLNFKSKGN